MRVWLFIMLIAVALAGCSRKQPPPPPGKPALNVVRPARRPVQEPHDGYVTSKSCRECHEWQYETWHRSYHRTMTQVASPQAVIAPLHGARMRAPGATVSVSQVADQYHVTVKHDNGAVNTGQVVLTTGSHHQQIYWMTSPRSNSLQLLPYAWLTEDQRWVPRPSVFLHPPTRPFRAEAGRWQGICIKCHATGGQPRMTRPHEFDTRVAEFGIACEACHGPGADHVEDESIESIVQPQLLSHQRSSQVCGQCHSVLRFRESEEVLSFLADGLTYRPGDDLSQARHLVRGGEHVDEPQNAKVLKDGNVDLAHFFWPDGKIRISGREYNGLVESLCYQRGEMSCFSCHVMHPGKSDSRSLDDWADDQLKPGMRGDQACLQCHDDFADDIAAHTHHPAGSTGSACMNCHMPYTTYGLLKAIRSHTVSSPSVSESVLHGRPNACNQCHIDQSLQWTDQHMQAWYEHAPVALTDDQKQIPASALWMLTGDAAQRALSAWAGGWPAAQQASAAHWQTPYLAHLLTDPYDAVRYIAARSLRSIMQDNFPAYDFVGDPAQRREIRRQLLDNADQTTQALIDRLSGQRDDRDIWLLE